MLMYVIPLVLSFVALIFFRLRESQNFQKNVRILKRDINVLGKFLVSIYHIAQHIRRQDTVAKIFTRLAKKHPEKVAFYFEEQKWTFQDVEKFSNKIANYFKSEGYRKGDNVALFMEAGPEYVCLWLGLSKIGVVTALINSNLFGDPLVHCVKVSQPKAVIYGSTLKDAVGAISQKLQKTALYQLNESHQRSELLEDATDLRTNLQDQLDFSPTEDIKKGKINDTLMYIYTSGTTGLPKAVFVPNFKYITVNTGMYYTMNLKENDVMYNCLPLYHSVGGMLGVGYCVVLGGTTAIRKKFSASSFWKDCTKYKCNVAMYIGELCRYLLAAHQNDREPIEHPVEKLIGSGLKAKIWDEFISKFAIKHVFELYASTEGNATIMNLDNTPGTVGFCPFFLKLFAPVVLVKCHPATAEPIRGSNGFCQLCKTGEPGLFLGKVNLKTNLVQFSGYTDKKATKKKLIRNVFKDGDVYFNSGDILVMDDMGYYYFRDRTGDTFRWKGENVSTAEVEAVVSNLLNLSDAVVYGVEIPDTDGKAGMAAIVHDLDSLDMTKFYKNLKDSLPSYAIPRFLRIVPSISLTGTFKIQKTKLQNEGLDLGKSKDKLFLCDVRSATYVELTKEKYNDVMSGKMKL